MKKKVQQKKEIVGILQPGVYWQYKKHPQQLLDKVDAFLSTFTAQLKALILPQKSLQQNYEAVAQKMGCNVHPSLSRKVKENVQYPELKNNDYGDKYALFMNHKIDAVTLRLFGFVIGLYKISTLKISNNNLQEECDQIKKLLQKQDQLITLYFQWNPLPDIARRQQIFLTTVRPSLQHLILRLLSVLLRQCKMGNQITKELLKKIRQNAQSKLISLDLYGNQLTNELSKELSTFVEQNKTIQFLGLSKNQLNSQQLLTKLFSSIGQIPLSQPQYQLHKQKQKVRDQVIDRNKKKKKGTADQAVPFVFEVKETATGRCYVKNVSLKIMNLATNGIRDLNAGLIRKFIETQGKHLELFIEGNKFTKTTKQTFKLYQNVIS